MASRKQVPALPLDAEGDLTFLSVIHSDMAKLSSVDDRLQYRIQYSELLQEYLRISNKSNKRKANVQPSGSSGEQTTPPNKKMKS